MHVLVFAIQDSDILDSNFFMGGLVQCTERAEPLTFQEFFSQIQGIVSIPCKFQSVGAVVAGLLALHLIHLWFDVTFLSFVGFCRV